MITTHANLTIRLKYFYVVLEQQPGPGCLFLFWEMKWKVIISLQQNNVEKL